MKKRLIVFLVCGLIILLLTGCSGRKETDNYIIAYDEWRGLSLDYGEKYAQRLKDLGLFGEHRLERFKTDNNLIGTLKGNFFLGFGGIDGEIHSFESLKFAWHFNPQDIIISSLALKDIVITIDETKEVPTIQFKFTICKCIFSDQTFIIAKGNPNIFINSKYICYARVRINSKDLQNEIYLPLNY